MTYQPLLNKKLFKIRSLLRRFHQDWGYDYENWQEAVDDYLSYKSKKDIRQANEELNWLISQPFSDAEFGQILFRELWCDYYPGEGNSYRQWLVEIEYILSKSLEEAEQVDNKSNPADKNTESHYKQNPSNDGKPNSVSYFEDNPTISFNDVFLYLLAGVISYPIVGFGGCVTRIVLQGSPPHPYDSAHESWLNSPIKSWTTEAIYISVAIVITFFAIHFLKKQFQDRATVIILLAFGVFGIMYLANNVNFRNFKFFSRQNSGQSSNYENRNRQNIIRAVIDTKDDSGLNIRLNKSLRSQSVIFAPEGSEVEILYYDNEWMRINGRKGRWCRVNYKGREGWAWGWYLEVIK